MPPQHKTPSRLQEARCWREFSMMRGQEQQPGLGLPANGSFELFRKGSHAPIGSPSPPSATPLGDDMMGRCSQERPMGDLFAVCSITIAMPAGRSRSPSPRGSYPSDCL